LPPDERFREPNAWAWFHRCGVNMTGSAIVALIDDPFMAKALPDVVNLAACREAHSKLQASGYFIGKNLDSDDLTAFDL